MEGTSRSGVLEQEGSGDTELTIALLSSAVLSCLLPLQGMCNLQSTVSTMPSTFVLMTSVKHIKWTRTEQGDLRLGISLEVDGQPISQTPLGTEA